MNKIFISGKVSGLDIEEARCRFRMVNRYLLGIYPDCSCVNPMEICHCDWSWLHCMAVCLWRLSGCDAVAFLPNWKDSRGSRIEYRFATFLGKDILFL